MPELMKKPRTKSGEPTCQVSVGRSKFEISKSRAERLVRVLTRITTGQFDSDSAPWREGFEDLVEKHGESGLAIRGARARDGLSQAELADKLGTTPQVISLLESGKRPVSKAMAKRLAEVFGGDWRVFL